MKPGIGDKVSETVEKVQGSQAWNSIFRPGSIFRKGYSDSPRNRSYVIMNSLLYHLHPVKVKRHAVKVSYTLCLGGLSFFLFIVLTVTGIFLMFFYRPTEAQAWGDIKQLHTAVTFGLLVRNMHRWGAHLMVLSVFLHMARVFYHGAYKAPREFNWVIGVILLTLTLLLSFTGYLLPWDQLSYWAVTVGTNLVGDVPLVGKLLSDLLIGGDQIGQATLQRFYALHVAVLPLLLAVVLMVHIWRVRKDGFAVRRGGTGAFAEEASAVAGDEPVVLPPTPVDPVPVDPDTTADGRRVRLLGVVDRESVTAAERLTDDTVFTWPHLLVRHVVVGLGVCATVLALGVAFAAPLRGIDNPSSTPEPAKAPWYFAGLQELLSHFDPLVAGILLPTAAFVVLLALPYIDRNPATEARNRRLSIVIFTTVLVVAVVLTVIAVFFRGPGWKFIAPWDHAYVEL
jgi:quinol-cytochrome oxidoreductase complex cytochrome b subunit